MLNIYKALHNMKNKLQKIKNFIEKLNIHNITYSLNPSYKVNELPYNLYHHSL